ncbi:MAG: hypothetical protein QNL62_11360 [Gammaproteobacteria bacterium]|nr:hypothetical protein [Gammaproteobacteria bacterium]
MIDLTFKKQTIRIIFFTISCMVLVSCVQPPVFKTEEYALIKSNYPIVAINGIEIEKSYQLDLEAGENSLLVVYNTYLYDYFCTFSWLAKAGTTYEITDQENQYPLTLYRWHRKNGLWAIRLDPVDPLECAQEPRP